MQHLQQVISVFRVFSDTVVPVIQSVFSVLRGRCHNNTCTSGCIQRDRCGAAAGINLLESVFCEIVVEVDL